MSYLEFEIAQSSAPAFVIRGHHLPFFAMVVSGRRSAEQQAYGRRYHAGRMREACLQSTTPDEDRFQYLYDVWGGTEQHADSVTAAELKMYEQFVDLPADYPILTVAGERDVMCGGCVVGAHCTMRTSMLRKDDLALRDSRYVKAFAEAAIVLGHPATLVARRAEFTDAPSASLPAVSATRAIAGLVLSSEVFLRHAMQLEMTAVRPG